MSTQMEMWPWFTIVEQRYARIDEATEDERVRKVLKALDKLCDHENEGNNRRYGVKLPDGSMKLTVSVPEVAQALRKSEPTTRKYLQAAADTPLMSAIWRGNKPHTFVINWPRVVDFGSADHRSRRRSSEQLNDIVSPAPGRHVDHTVQGVTRSSGSDDRAGQPDCQGVIGGNNLGANEGENPNLPPNLPTNLPTTLGAKLPKSRPPVLNPGSSINDQNIPGFKTGLAPQGSKTAKSAQKLVGKRGCDRPTFRPWTDLEFDQLALRGEAPGWRFLDQLRRIFAVFDIRNPLHVQRAYEQCTAIGAVVESQMMRLAFFAEAEWGIARATYSPAGWMKDQVLKNRRFANDDHTKLAQGKIASIPSSKRADEIQRLLEADAAGRFVKGTVK